MAANPRLVIEVREHIEFVDTSENLPFEDQVQQALENVLAALRSAQLHYGYLVEVDAIAVCRGDSRSQDLRR